MALKCVTLTEDEANNILGILSELPIRYLSIVQVVQQIFAKKFATLEQSEESSAIYDL